MKLFRCIVIMLLCLGGINALAEVSTLINANKIIDKLKTEIANEPNNVENRIELGVIYFQLQESILAKQYFEEALKIDNDNAIARYNLGKTLIILGETEEGIAECEESLNLGLEDINVYMTLSVEYFNKRNLKKSLEMYKNIQRIEPQNDSAYFAAGVIYIGLRDGWKARKEFEKAVEVNPNHVEAHYELGWLYRNYDSQQSKEHYQRVLELNPNHKKAQKELTELLSRKK